MATSSRHQVPHHPPRSLRHRSAAGPL